jgi:hypothetical protein
MKVPAVLELEYEGDFAVEITYSFESRNVKNFLERITGRPNKVAMATTNKVYVENKSFLEGSYAYIRVKSSGYGAINFKLVA